MGLLEGSAVSGRATKEGKREGEQLNELGEIDLLVRVISAKEN